MSIAGYFRHRKALANARAMVHSMTDAHLAAIIVSTPPATPIHVAALDTMCARLLESMPRRCEICSGDFTPIGGQRACKPCTIPFPHLS